MPKIKLKRGQSADIAALHLDAGEPAFTLDTGKLYLGDGKGNKVLINPEGGTATTADRLATPRNFSVTGDATAPPVAFDGSDNVELELTLENTGVSAGTYPKVTVDAKGRVKAGTLLEATDIPDLTLAKITDAGTAAKKNTGTATGDIPVLGTNGKIDPSMLPAIAITDTFVANTQAAMLALSDAETGDICVRTDLSKSFILKAEPASTPANWQELLTPQAPTDITGNAATATKLAAPKKINDVDFDGSKDIIVADDTKEPKITASTAATYWNGEKAFVDFAASVRDALLTGLVTTNDQAIAAADTILAALGKLQAQITKRAPLANPALTGVPTAPTATAETDTTQIATTAFVHSQGYLTPSSVIDGGTF